MPGLDDRGDILKACSKKLDLGTDVNLSFFAGRTEGFTGADLQSLVYNAHLDAIHELLEARKEESSSSKPDSSASAQSGSEQAVEFVSTAKSTQSMSMAARGELSSKVSILDQRKA